MTSPYLTTTQRRVLNKRTDAIPSNAVYVGRPSVLGNPFVIGRDGTREEVIRKYDSYATERIRCDPVFRQAVAECAGRDLVCWCAPLSCHGDVILRLHVKGER